MTPSLTKAIKYTFYISGILAFFILPNRVQTQSLDSLVMEASNLEDDTAYIKFIHDQIWGLRFDNRSLAYDLLDHMEAWYDQNQNTYRRDANIYYYGLLHKYDGAYQKSAVKFQDYLDYQIKMKDSARIGAVYNALSNLYFDQSILDTSMLYTTKALDIYYKIKDTSTYVNMLTRKGILLMEVDRFEEALEHQKEAMQLGKNQNSPRLYANVLNNTALVYEAMKMQDSTILYYRKYMDYAIEHDLTRAIYYAEYNLATALIKEKEYDESLSLLQSAYQRADAVNDSNMRNYILIGLAELYNTKEMHRQALAQISLMDVSKNTVEHKKEMHRQAYEAYKMLGNTKSALEAHEKYKLFADSMLNESISEQIQDIEAKYETKKKEQTIENLKVVQEANEKRLFYQFGIIILSILALGILSFLFFKLKGKNKIIRSNNVIIQKNLEQKNLLLQEIHHRVKNNLQVISSLLRLQTRSATGNAAEALTSSENRVQSMALIHQHLYEGDDISSVHMNTYLSDLAEKVVESHSTTAGSIELELNVPNDLELDVKSVVPIGLITNEWLTNACKYAFTNSNEGKIFLTFKQTNRDSYVLEIRDNGDGFDTSGTENEGFGSRLVNAFAKRVKGKLTIENNGGTHCKLEFPIPSA